MNKAKSAIELWCLSVRVKLLTQCWEVSLAAGGQGRAGVADSADVLFYEVVFIVSVVTY